MIIKSVKGSWSFSSIDYSSGKGLRDVILKFLQTNNLEFIHYRGQRYDNAASMKGKNSGEQKKIRDNLPAFFIPS
jgi:hypothetical protein